jgi:hypothetical protein
MKEKVLFPVGKYPLKIIDESVEEKAKGDRGVAIVRLDTFEIIYTPSAEYELVLHGDILDSVEKVLKTSGYDFRLSNIFVGGKANNNMFANYDLVVNGSNTAFIQVQNSYDGGRVYHMVTGLYVGGKDSAILVEGENSGLLKSLRHRGKNINLSLVQLDFSKWINFVTDCQNKLEQLKAIPLNDDAKEKILRQILEYKKDLRAFEDSGALSLTTRVSGNNFYALLNALAFYATTIMPNNPKLCKNYGKANSIMTKIPSVFFNFV